MNYSPSMEFSEKQKLAPKASPVTQDTVTGMLLKANTGYANVPIKISKESELVNIFGEPNNYNYMDWFNAAGYLKYASNLYIVRPLATTAENAYLKITPSTITYDETGANLYNEDIASITLNNTSYADYPESHNIHFFNRYVSTLNDTAVLLCTNETEWEESISKDDIFDNTLAVKTIFDIENMPTATDYANKDRIIVQEITWTDDPAYAVTDVIYHVYYANYTSSTTATWVDSTDTIEDGDRVYITSEQLAYDFAIDYDDKTIDNVLTSKTIGTALPVDPLNNGYSNGDRLVKQTVNAGTDDFSIWELTNGSWVDTTEDLEAEHYYLILNDQEIYKTSLIQVDNDGNTDLVTFAVDETHDLNITSAFTQDTIIKRSDVVLIKKDTNGIISNSVVKYMDTSLYDSNYNPLTYSDVLTRKPDFTKEEIGIVVLKLNREKYYEIVETFIHSLDSTSKMENGRSNYIDTNINKYSKYIYCLSNACTNNGVNAISNNAYSVIANTITDNTVNVDYSDITDFDTLYDSANAVFGNNGYLSPELLIGYDCGDANLYSGYLNAMPLIAKDTEFSLAIVSPTRPTIGASETVINDEMVNDLGNRRTDTSFGALTEFNSYTFTVGNMKKYYDKYNDKFRWVTVAGDIAGMMTRNDNLFGVQSALAGFNRGEYINYSKMLFDSTVNQDILSYNGINAIIYDYNSDKRYLMDYLTATNLDEITKEANIRRMIIRIKHLLKKELKGIFFEFNNETTRSQVLFKISTIFQYFTNNGALSDYLLICDDTNNTEEKINANEFVLDIKLQPNRTIKYININISLYDMGLDIREV